MQMNISRKLKIGGMKTAFLLTATLVGQAQTVDRNQATAQAGAAPTSVLVVNTPAQAVPTKDRNHGAYQPFFGGGNFSLLGNTYVSQFTVPVPAGKRLVIEQFSMTITASVGGATPILWVDTTAAGVATQTFLNAPTAVYDAGTSIFSDLQPVRIYADGGTSVVVHVRKTSDAFNSYNTAMSGAIRLIGYLVDIP
jgi:hypothetical protein